MKIQSFGLAAQAMEERALFVEMLPALATVRALRLFRPEPVCQLVAHTNAWACTHSK